MLNGKRLQGAGDYTSRLLIVEVSSNNWKNKRMPAKFAVLIGVKIELQILESECVWDYVLQFPPHIYEQMLQDTIGMSCHL